MKKYTQEDVTYEILDYLNCDICGRKLKTNSKEYSSCVSIRKEFGYGSDYFGDNTTIDIDLCEKCMHNIIEEKGLTHLIKKRDFILEYHSINPIYTPEEEVKLAKGSKF